TRPQKSLFSACPRVSTRRGLSIPTRPTPRCKSAPQLRGLPLLQARARRAPKAGRKRTRSRSLRALRLPIPVPITVRGIARRQPPRGQTKLPTGRQTVLHHSADRFKRALFFTRTATRRLPRHIACEW